VSRRRSLLAVETTTAAGASVLIVSGVLDGTTYVILRDAIKKAALDRPRAVIVDIAGLIVIGGSAWAVFPPAGWYLTDEQNVPMGLICNTIDGHRALCRNAVDRCVPAYRTLDAAIAELTGNNRDQTSCCARKATLAGATGSRIRWQPLLRRYDGSTNR
jgi:hypothetical protein